MSWSRGGVVMALTSVLVLVGRGVAAADTVPQEKDTSAGYRMKLSMDKVTIQSVPNMAGAPLVREGYVTATAKLEIECVNKDNKDGCPGIVQSALQVSAQIGCPNDLRNGIGLQPGATIDAGLPATLGGLLPANGDITAIDIAPTVRGGGPGPIQADIKPGFITDLQLGGKTIPPTSEELRKLQSIAELAQTVKGEHVPGIDADIEAIGQSIATVLNTTVDGPDGGLVVSVENRHIVVDRSKEATGACGGPVAIRMYASGAMRTATTSDKVDMFGDIYSL